jgi:hypothetical protein
VVLDPLCMPNLAIVGGCLGLRNRHTITAELPYSVLHSLDSGNLAFDGNLHAFVARLEVHAAQLAVYTFQLTGGPITTCSILNASFSNRCVAPRIMIKLATALGSSVPRMLSSYPPSRYDLRLSDIL